MRTPTLLHLASQLRRGTILAVASFALVTGLTACDGANPTEPNLKPSVDRGLAPIPQGPLLVAAPETAAASSVSTQAIASPFVRRRYR